jgi:hypothetical protein
LKSALGMPLLFWPDIEEVTSTILPQNQTNTPLKLTRQTIEAMTKLESYGRLSYFQGILNSYYCTIIFVVLKYNTIILFFSSCSLLF